MSQRTGGIARAAVIMMGAFVVSRVLGLARESVLASLFGTSPELGAYQAAFRIPDFLFNVIGAGAIGSAFIPVFVEATAQSDETEAWRLASGIMNLLTLVLLVTASAAAIAAPELTRTLLAPGYTPEEQALTAELARVMLLSPILFGVSGLLTAILNSHQQFFLPSLAPIVYNLAIILGALILAPMGYGVRGLAAGAVLGSALHLAVQLPGLRGLPSHYSWTLGLHDARVRKVAVLLGPRVLGMAAVQLNFWMNTNLASRLPDGAARVTALNYAWLLMLLPQGVFALSIANAVFPTFSAQAARGDRDALRETLATLLRLVLFVSIPASLGLFLLRTPLIQLLFQRGEFTAASTDITAYALQFYALGLFAHSALEIVTRAYYALHDTLTPVLYGAAAMLANILLSLVFIGALGHGGLALANTLATTMEMAILVAILRRRLGGLGEELWNSLARTLSATAVMALVLMGLLLVLPPLPGALVALVGVSVGALSFILAALLLRAPEMLTVQAILSRVLGRWRPNLSA